MLIEIVADFSCPWCFIGLRRLRRACALRPHVAVETAWQPFQLNPELPSEGIDRILYLRGKFGSWERMQSLEIALEESGAKEGIRFAFERIRRTPNTLAAHRMMRLAGRAGRQDALAEQLFTAYFERGQDLGDCDALVACAAAAGLDAGQVRTFLDSDADRETVAAIDELARQSGITGVPYFIFDRRYALAGAQEPATFLPLFDALTADAPELLASRA